MFQPQFFTSSAPLYNTHRPSYPASAVSALLDAMHIIPPSNTPSDPRSGSAPKEKTTILELGAGTGLFTAALASALSKSNTEEGGNGFEILAAEPYAVMREELASTAKELATDAKELPRVRVKVLGLGAEELAGVQTDGNGDEGGLGGTEGKGEGERVETESVEGVVCAQAFHWFANRRALEQIYRVLVPGGVLGLIWNVEEPVSPLSWPTTTAYESRLRDIVYSEPYEDHSARQFRHLNWRAVFEDDQIKSTPLTTLLVGASVAEDPLFSLPLGEASEAWTTRWRTKGEIWRNWETKSQVARLNEAEKEEVKKRFDEVLDADDVERDGEGKIAVHGKTYWVWTSKIPGAPLKEGG